MFKPTFVVLSAAWVVLMLAVKPHPSETLTLCSVGFLIVACTIAKTIDDRRASSRPASQSPPRE